MAYENNNNNQFNNNPRAAAPRKATAKSETDGIILTNERAGRFLKTRFWNRTMGIDIGSYPPGSPITYDTVRKAQLFSHVFSFSTLFELYDICEEVLDSIKNTGTFESTATEAGQKKDVILEISNGKNINMNPGIYLVMYKQVDTGKRTNTMEIYPFGSSKVLREYDHNTGYAKEDIKANGEFKKFVMCLKEAAKAFTMAQAHAINDVNKNERMAILSSMNAVASAMGVDISKAVDASNSFSAGKSSGGSSYNRPASTQQSPGQYQRKSQPGQWKSNGGTGGYQRNNYNSNGGYQQRNNYQQQQAAMAAISDEPVDINLDMATLQNVSLDQFK